MNQQPEPYYSFKRYEKPKTGIFKINTDEFNPQRGWVYNEEKHQIIGEDRILYITGVLNTEKTEWIDDCMITRQIVIPLGINKTRLLTWGSYQLELQF